jgi:hypothetical protein
MRRLQWILLGAGCLLAGAALAQTPQPDPKAVALMREVHRNRYGWDESFPGFEGRLTVSYGGEEHKGLARVGKDLGVEVRGVSNEAAAKWARESLASIVAHRRTAPFERGDGRYPLTLGPSDEHASGRLIRLNDPMNSTYRVRDGQIMQINRAAGPNRRFTIDIVENQRTDGEKVLPRVFTVAYFLSASGELERSETYWEGYRKVGAYYLPEFRRQITAEDSGTNQMSLKLSELKLLE